LRIHWTAALADPEAIEDFIERGHFLTAQDFKLTQIRQCERSEPIQESSGALRFPGLLHRYAPRDDGGMI
jgi:hypothetical protein